jgi:hypothetical protein
MNITMEQIERRLTAVEKDTKKILFYIESDPTTNSKGLVEKLIENEKRIELLELKNKLEKVRTGFFVAGISGVFVVIGFVIEAWINQKFR